MITKFKLNRESCRNAELIPWVTPWFWYPSTTNSSSALQKYTMSPSKRSLLYFEIPCYLYLSCSWLNCLAEKHSPLTPVIPISLVPDQIDLSFGILCFAYCPQSVSCFHFNGIQNTFLEILFSVFELPVNVFVFWITLGDHWEQRFIIVLFGTHMDTLAHNRATLAHNRVT